MTSCRHPAVLPAALPFGPATATALVSNFDHDRRASPYDEMVAVLRRPLAELPHLHTADLVCAFVEHCEETLLKENIEWAAAQKHIENQGVFSKCLVIARSAERAVAIHLASAEATARPVQ